MKHWGKTAYALCVGFQFSFGNEYEIMDFVCASWALRLKTK